MRRVLLASAFLLCACNSDRIARLEKENKELAEKLKQAQQGASLDLQSKCAKQARDAYNEAGFEKDQLANFVNHYNTRLNKCFVEMFQTKSDVRTEVPSESRTLSDAFEGKIYGNYYWVNREKKRYWEVKPSECEVTDIGGKQIKCDSSDEFDDLIKQFMDE